MEAKDKETFLTYWLNDEKKKKKKKEKGLNKNKEKLTKEG